MNESTYTAGILVEQTIDHGDGTGTRTTYAPDGTILTTETVELPPTPDPEPTPEDRIAALEDLIRSQADTIDQLIDALGGDDGPED